MNYLELKIQEIIEQKKRVLLIVIFLFGIAVIVSFIITINNYYLIESSFEFMSQTKLETIQEGQLLILSIVMIEITAVFVGVFSLVTSFFQTKIRSCVNEILKQFTIEDVSLHKSRIILTGNKILEIEWKNKGYFEISNNNKIIALVKPSELYWKVHYLVHLLETDTKLP